MILKGSQRGNAAQLARHLLNLRENEHVELHELRGFSSAGSREYAFRTSPMRKPERDWPCCRSIRTIHTEATRQIALHDLRKMKLNCC